MSEPSKKAPKADHKADLIQAVDASKKPGLAPTKVFEVDPAYFEGHLAEAEAAGKKAQIHGNAVRVDH